MGPKKGLPLCDRVDLGVIVNGVIQPPRSPELEPHHQMPITVIPRTLLFVSVWEGSVRMLTILDQMDNKELLSRLGL